MFEAGALIWRIQTIGKNELKQDLAESERAAASAGAALNDTGKSVDDLGKKSDASRPKVRGMRDEIKGMSTTAQQASREVGTVLAVIGAAVIAASALAVNAAKEWETAWTGVVKTVDATPVELERIESGLRDLTKVLPASHSEIAAVAEAAGQLGVKAKDIVAFTRTMVDLGETTNLTADEAATSLAQFMNIMQTAPEDVHRLGSAVVALGNNGASTERDIVQMSQRIAGAGKIIGLTEGETLGLANALASVGIEAEAGGSSVSNIMIDIANAVSQKGEKLLKWAELAGMSADEFSEKYRTKPAEAIALVIEGLGRLNKSGGDVFATLSDLGQTDVRVTRSLLSLANSGDLLRKSLELGNQAWEDDLALQAEAEKRYETTAAKLDMARNSVNDMAIELGEHLLPFVEVAAGAIGGLADLIGSMPDEAQGAVAVLGAVAGGILLVSGAGFLAVPRVVAFVQAVRTLREEMPVATARAQGMASFLTGPWGIAIAGATALIAGFINMHMEYEQGVDSFTDSLDRATGAVTASTRELAYQTLEQKNATKFAKEMGVSLDLVTSAALGNEEAYRKVREQMQAYYDAEAAGAGKNETSIKMGEVAGAIDYVRSQLGDSKKAWEDQSQAMGEGADSAQDATDAYSEQREVVGGLQQDLDALIESIFKANGANRDGISANIDYQAALRDADEAIESIRDGVEGYTNGLDVNTEAGARNMQALLDIADAAEGVAQDVANTTYSEDAFRASLEASRSDLLQRIEDFGVHGDAAIALRDDILSIPPKAETEAIVRTAQALQAVTDLKNSLAAFQSSSYGVNVSGYIKSSDRALGGIDYVNHMAVGGIKSNRGVAPQVRRAGEVTVWAEHETGGESYIPWANDHRRPRAVAVLERTANEFGYELIPAGARPFAEGGTGAPFAVASTTPTRDTRPTTDLSNSSIDRLARALAALLRNNNRDGGRSHG